MNKRSVNGRSEYVDWTDWRDYGKIVLSAAGPSTPDERLVLLALRTHADPQMTAIVPGGQRKLLAETHLAERTLQRALARAERDGWIVASRTRNAAGHITSTIYDLTIPPATVAYGVTGVTTLHHPPKRTFTSRQNAHLPPATVAASLSLRNVFKKRGAIREEPARSTMLESILEKGFKNPFADEDEEASREEGGAA